MTQPEDPTQSFGDQPPSQPSVPADSPVPPPPAAMPEPGPAPQPQAPTPGAFVPPDAQAAAAPTPPVADAPAAPPMPAMTPMPMSGPASTDTEMWEVPPASAAAGAAAASQWSQPAPAVPQPLPQQPAPPPPAPAWQQPQQAAPPPPAQQWQTPPPPPQSWQQPQQPWQQQQPQQYQQPYGQPYGQNPYAQPYPQQYAAQVPSYGTSPLAAFAGLLLVVFGIGVIVLGVLTLGQGADLARFIRDNDIKVFGIQLSRDLLRAVLTPSPGILMFLGFLQLVSGIGVMAHKSWGRWLGVLLALFGLIVSIFAFSIGYALAGGFTVPVIIGVVFVAGYVLILLALIAGGAHFRRRSVAR